MNRRLIVTALAEDRPDLLTQTVGLLHRRAFSIETLTVGRTDQDHLARLTLTLQGPPSEAERLERELGRLLYVLEVDDLSNEPVVARDLALIKVEACSDTRAKVAQLCEVFRARIVDVAEGSVIIEITGDAEKIDGFLAVLRPFGIVEMARTGPVALGRAERALPNDAPESSWRERRRRADAARSN